MKGLDSIADSLQDRSLTVVFLIGGLFVLWLKATGRLDSISRIQPASASSASNVVNSGKTATVPDANEQAYRKALRSVGFTPSGVNTMIAIGKAESGLRANATNDNPGVEYSVGPYQINLLAHPQVSEADARDPLRSAYWAYQISGGGKNFSPWTTYTSGKYLRYLMGGK